MSNASTPPETCKGPGGEQGHRPRASKPRHHLRTLSPQGQGDPPQIYHAQAPGRGHHPGAGQPRHRLRHVIRKESTRRRHTTAHAPEVDTITHRAHLPRPHHHPTAGGPIPPQVNPATTSGRHQQGQAPAADMPRTPPETRKGHPGGASKPCHRLRTSSPQGQGARRRHTAAHAPEVDTIPPRIPATTSERDTAGKHPPQICHSASPGGGHHDPPGAPATPPDVLTTTAPGRHPPTAPRQGGIISPASSEPRRYAKGTPAARFSPPIVPFLPTIVSPGAHHEHRTHAPGDMQGTRR